MIQAGQQTNRGSIPGIVKYDQASILAVGSWLFPLWCYGRGVELTTIGVYGIEVKNAQCTEGQLDMPERVQIGSTAH